MLTRIVIAERQLLFGAALRSLLESQPDFAVVGQTGDGDHLLKLVLDSKPDVLLLGLKLRNHSGLEALRLIAEPLPNLRAILLTETIAPAAMIQFLLSGVRGLVFKNTPTELLFKSIRSVADGQYWLSNHDISEVVKNMCSFAELAQRSAQLQARSLSPQQLQIMEAIVAGCSNKDIAKDLSMSERTVKYHLTRMFNTFGVAGRLELARYSLNNKVVPEG
jgi:two-component system nitrate/nitrite response regulator NarL